MKKAKVKAQENNQHEELGPQAYADIDERLDATPTDAPSPDAQARTETETRAFNLQLFAETPIDMGRIADITDPSNPKFLFATMGDAGEEANDGSADDDTDAEESVPDDPVLFPRLAVTDQNLPYTVVGEAVVRSTDGELYSVAVEKDGAVTDSSFQIGADNIEEGCITGSKLEENTITSRELDMTEIFADATLLNQTLAENLDTEGLFNNDAFLARLDERVAGKAVLKEGDTMTGPLVLTGDPVHDLGAATKQYVAQAIATLSPLAFREVNA